VGAASCFRWSKQSFVIEWSLVAILVLKDLPSPVPIYVSAPASSFHLYADPGEVNWKTMALGRLCGEPFVCARGPFLWQRVALF
jgi:hypothetical protein